MNLEKLEKLNELREKGVITDEEFQRAKQKILDGTPFSEAASNLDGKSYSVLMHLSQLCSFIIPLSGMVIPLVMWLLKKDDPYIDAQGKVIINWLVSAIIYFAVSVALTVIVIGAFLLVALAACAIIFAILGALRANDGVIRNYPLAIRFFKVEEN
jgi:uncharacterized Tic20 family protein